MDAFTHLKHIHTEIVIPFSAEVFQDWRVPEQPYTESLSHTHKGIIKFNLYKGTRECHNSQLNGTIITYARTLHSDNKRTVYFCNLIFLESN